MYQGRDYNNFEISNYVNVRNICRNNVLSGRLENGYRIVCLRDNITKKSYLIKCHILVANYFIIKKPFNGAVVNHKDKNRQNNHVSNLEWLTGQENTEHGCGRKIQQFSLNGQLVREFKSIKEACILYGYNKNSHVAVSKCCRGINKSAYGFVWKYIN